MGKHGGISIQRFLTPLIAPSPRTRVLAVNGIRVEARPTFVMHTRTPSFIQKLLATVGGSGIRGAGRNVSASMFGSAQTRQEASTV